MDEVLRETFGIMIYQENVTKLAMALAGFSIEQADDLRKVLSMKPKQKSCATTMHSFVTVRRGRGAC